MSGGPDLSPDFRDLRAAEYVLGTLTAQERAAFEAEAGQDPHLAALLSEWERRLAPLSLAVPEESPPGHVWAKIAEKLSKAEPRATDPSADADAANDNRIAGLTRQVRRWRFATVAAGLVAAGLALVIGLNPPMPVQPEAGRFVAVVTSAGEAPALIVTVDTARGTAQVRPVGAQTPPGKSLELWYVGADKQPKSLGLLGSASSRVGLPAGAGTGEGVFAVSVEPPGGSQTGQPTGEVVYKGQLIRE